MEKNTPIPFCLYPGYDLLKDFRMCDYPEIKMHVAAPELPEWILHQWNWGKDYLLYIGRNKSPHTFSRFRIEIERFLLWSMLVKKQPIAQFRKAQILEYIDFCWSPPPRWITSNSNNHLVYSNGYYRTNEQWAPFNMPRGAKASTGSAKAKSTYRPSQQTITAIFTGITAFYKHLNDEEHCFGNPAQLAKKDCRHLLKDTQITALQRLTEEDWNFALNTITKHADEHPEHERSLFVFAAIKTLMLRISELSERPGWRPLMSHFSTKNGDYWLTVLGKGRKIRDISVPDSFISYLKRYRLSRGLTEMPLPNENEDLIHKLRGSGGLTSRQLRRIVQDVYDIAADEMEKTQGKHKAMALRSATTHWLRHTGASMEIERGRPIKHLSEELGHSSMATTDMIYVQADPKLRADSGKSRDV